MSKHGRGWRKGRSWRRSWRWYWRSHTRAREVANQFLIATWIARKVKKLSKQTQKNNNNKYHVNNILRQKHNWRHPIGWLLSYFLVVCASTSQLQLSDVPLLEDLSQLRLDVAQVGGVWEDDIHLQALYNVLADLGQRHAPRHGHSRRYFHASAGNRQQNKVMVKTTFYPWTQVWLLFHHNTIKQVIPSCPLPRLPPKGGLSILSWEGTSIWGVMYFAIFQWLMLAKLPIAKASINCWLSLHPTQGHGSNQDVISYISSIVC